MKKSYTEMVADMEALLKNAFAVDGYCKFVDWVDVHVSKPVPIASVMFELTDSKRGTFYVTVSK